MWTRILSNTTNMVSDLISLHLDLSPLYIQAMCLVLVTALVCPPAEPLLPVLLNQQFSLRTCWPSFRGKVYLPMLDNLWSTYCFFMVFV